MKGNSWWTDQQKNRQEQQINMPSLPRGGGGITMS